MITYPANKRNIHSGVPGNADIRSDAQSVQNINAQQSLYNKSSDASRGKSTTPNNLNTQNQSIARYQFPDDIGIYYMTFTFMSYSRDNIKSLPKSSLEAEIALAIPATLVDALHERYEELQTNLLGTIMNNFSGGNMSGVATGAVAGLGAAAIASIAEKAGLGGQALENARQAFAIGLQASNLAFNPSLSVFYTTPSFKQHEFVWKFSPKTPDESNRIREIIKKFHYYMSPETVADGIFFRYPHIVLPKIYAGDKESEYLHKFKACVIENCAINYAPSGVPSFFAGTRAPTEIEMRLSLKETELWLKDDYQ